MALSSDQLAQNIITYLINPAVYLLIAVAVLVFVWGVVRYISNSDNPEEQTKGKQHILWGLFGFVMMLGAWGIIAIFANTFEQIEQGTFNSSR